MNKEYKIKLDLNKKLYNKKMAFNQFDENVNDFYIEVTKNNEIVKDLDKAIVVLAVIKPNKEVDSQFVEVENGVVYANLKPSMKDEIGIYTARAMLILESEKVVTDVISYEVKEDKIFSLLNDTVETTEEFTLLTDMLSRLSTIELNENNREETFNNIKDEFEIIKNNHNELVTTETDNKVTELLGPVVSKANEKINEVDNKIVDIENAISEADSKINNAIAKIPPKSELIGEKGDKGEKGEKGDKGDRGEQGLQGIQGIQGIQGERGLQGVKGDKGDKGEQGIQGLKGDKGDKGDRGEQGVKGDTPSITHLETSINNKIQEVETRFNTLISAQQQDAEVIDARDGETSLKARLDRDIEKAKQVYVNVEGSHISTDSSVGYLKDVEILGNTIQSASNLADIRSVGDKVEGQELYEIPVLSRGKNLLSCGFECGDISFTTGLPNTNVDTLIRTKDYIKVEPNQNIKFSNIGLYSNAWFFAYDYNKNFICIIENVNNFITPNNCKYIKFRTRKANSTTIDLVDIPSYKIQIEEGTVATPYEPYVEDKLTILSPTPLEKVGDVADRIIEKNGVWGIEKNTIRKSLTASSVAHNGTVNGLTEYIIDTLENSDTTITSNVICNKLVNKFSTTEEGCFVTKNQFRVRVLTNTYPNAESIKNEVINNKWYIIYKSAQPQFIPLPHDQQVKLRAFANKTNISFLTETEGTIKAQVPKSLGATVNTHTTQISNLNKELDRVKKLEESTVSTVETESDFTTVEATSNGYFEDVKLEGKTLVVNSDNEVAEPGTEGAILKSVGQDVEEVSVASVNSDETQSDKKRLLYYNEETQTWEKPILREWDSIEKHSDGKYYYHVRSKEGDYVEGDESLNDCITDLTVSVKKLAEEKVYECTNIDLITYANETNYVVESGAIVPKTTLKVHNNISNVVSLLQKKVSLLESNMTKYMITQNRMQLASTYSADSVTFKVDYFSLCGDEENYDEDLYNLILNNILVGKDNYDYDKMFTMILDYASWNQISWEQFDILVGLMDMQHNPPVEEIPTEDEVIEETPNEIM